jgi:hypothetical protein
MGTDPIFLRATLSNGKWGLSPFSLFAYLPVQRGGRFSTKAFTPSRKSALP